MNMLQTARAICNIITETLHWNVTFGALSVADLSTHMQKIQKVHDRLNETIDLITIRRPTMWERVKELLQSAYNKLVPLLFVAGKQVLRIGSGHAV